MTNCVLPLIWQLVNRLTVEGLEPSANVEDGRGVEEEEQNETRQTQEDDDHGQAHEDSGGAEGGRADRLM